MEFQNILLILQWFVAISALDNVEKRILLNDPTYIQNQFQHFQEEIQSLQVKISSLETTTSTLQTTVTAQQNTIAAQQNVITSFMKGGKGTHFTIWGHTSCPNNITTTYTGYAGGSWYDHTGGAANYVCMPSDPIYGPKKDFIVDSLAYVYGAEYEGTPAYWGLKDKQEDVPCAVCFTSVYATTVMIPGRTQCYPGWTEAYHGDLASGYHGQKSASEYVCVNEHAQVLVGHGDINDDGALFYPVNSKCGSLKCPPYENDKKLSCVVCMK